MIDLQATPMEDLWGEEAASPPPTAAGVVWDAANKFFKVKESKHIDSSTKENNSPTPIKIMSSETITKSQQQKTCSNNQHEVPTACYLC